MQINSKTHTHTQLQMSKGLEHTFLQRRYMKGQQVHEKMVITTCC